MKGGEGESRTDGSAAEDLAVVHSAALGGDAGAVPRSFQHARHGLAGVGPAPGIALGRRREAAQVVWIRSGIPVRAVLLADQPEMDIRSGDDGMAFGGFLYRRY